MERETGIEPATSSLGSWRSTAELLPLGQRTKLAYHRGGEASTELALAGTGFVSGHRFSDAVYAGDMRAALAAGRSMRQALKPVLVFGVRGMPEGMP
jgi:hypothetical protein